MHFSIRLVLLAFAQNGLAVSPIVNLPYTSYQGTALSNGITQWLGMRYAAAPTGDYRFAAPQPPPTNKTIQPANAAGKYCVTQGTAPDTTDTSEDCLFVNVYAPTNATSESLLPVYFYIQGGGMDKNANPNLNGAGLIAASGFNMVFVAINYRVGLYGFLASQGIQQNASLNNGLKDQRKALFWVQQNIAQFGGNPDHVVMGGDSAGGESVTLQLAAYGGHNASLFHATTSESQAFPVVLNVSESQYQYDGLVARSGCSTNSAYSTILQCLRSLSTAQLVAIDTNTVPYPGAPGPPIDLYGATLDHDFLTDYPYNLFAQGKFVKVPAIYGDDTNEGTIFAPQSTNSSAQVAAFLVDQYPTLTQTELNLLNQSYPQSATTQYPNTGKYWQQLAEIYGELRYICPGIFLSDAYANYSVSQNFNYRWDVLTASNNQSGLGVTHTSELAYILSSGSSSSVVPIIQGYWTSFIRTFDPNTYRHPGSPEWVSWSPEPVTATSQRQRILFQNSSTQVETVSTAQLQRCQYFQSIAVSLKQ